MKDWEKTEKKVHQYLVNSIELESISFEWLGSSDSTEPDIKVMKNDENIFSIEVKMPKSQTSQFVVTLEDDKFSFSKNNKVTQNKYADKIIETLNENFDYYKSVKQGSYDVPVPLDVALNWIKSTYLAKGSRYVGTTLDNDSIKVFPIEQFQDNFEVTCNLRRKKSGSRELAKKAEADFNKFKHKGIAAKEYRVGKKYFVETTRKLNKNEIIIQGEDNNYKYSIKDEKKYEIRTLGKTNNPNIIFSLSLKGEVDKPELDTLTQEILKYLE